ncbi:hypothetical protein Zmor_015494 [Zophobas morio]|uniref:Glucose-methanol-choline oxidoreductase N-terminal domain-containing protein n=1 Tax=Zophobas morio TaxID=2755281 RepID=A0AA38IMP1_9CUCU|nr:hypothetical protein Zmor_015494 [Zophobas morio]
MLNSTATKVLLETTGDQKTISAVEFIYNDTTFTVQVNREAIVSGGSINSPQLLLLSGIGPKNELDKVGIEQVHDLPGVGQNLHNHVSFGMNFNLNLVKNTNDLDWLAALNYFTHRTGGRFSNSFAKMRIRIDAHAKMLFETKIRVLERDPMRISTRCAYERLCSSGDMATAAKCRGNLNAMVGRTHAVSV